MEQRQTRMEPVKDAEFSFIDLFAGIGGIRRGIEDNGGQCVYTSEWNKFSQITYGANYADDDHEIVGDITQVDVADIPDHDLLVGGFPCQPFSLAGVSKKNSLGRAHGFADPTQGTLFFDIVRILKARRPAAFLLENVKNLRGHDGGRTFAIIEDKLRNELGYELHTMVIDGAHFVPQHRERILLVGFAAPTTFSWSSLQLPAEPPTMCSVLHRRGEPANPHDGDRYFDTVTGQVNAKYTLTPKLWEYLQNYAAKHRAAGNGFGYGLVGPDSVARTLSARYHKDGSEVLVDQGPGQRPRRLTPRECARLMGFPETFEIPVSDTQAYRQFGNSVVVPMFSEVGRIMKPHILSVMYQPKARIAG